MACGVFAPRTPQISVPIAEKLADQIRSANGEVVAGDCHLANTAITEQTGEEPLHPLQLIARAYGISEEVAAALEHRSCGHNT